MRNFFLSLLVFFVGVGVKAQNVPENISSRIAQKMKDSLSLSEVQKTSIYTINMDIHNRKAVVWQQAETDSVGVGLQRIENTRDSLYRPILTDEQYILYKNKKKNLISAN